MGRRPKEMNITKIAREAGVSESTVSRALNHRVSVRETTREKILEVARKYDFSLAPARPREKKIALLPNSTYFSDYIDDLFSGVYKYATENMLGTSIIFPHTHSSQTLLEQFRDQQCAGAIMIPPFPDSKNLNQLAESGLPVILIDDSTGPEKFGFISHDSYAGSKEAAEYLLKLGHRKIGYLKTHVAATHHKQRFQAYKDAMQQAGISVPPKWIIRTVPHTDLRENSAVQIQELLRQSPELTAVMTSGDGMAIGAVRGAVVMGRNVPGDLSIIGFNNYKLTKLLNPPLTTVNHPLQKIGFLAAQYIDEYLKNPKDAQLPHRILPTELIIRESTCPPGKQRGRK